MESEKENFFLYVIFRKFLEILKRKEMVGGEGVGLVGGAHGRGRRNRGNSVVSFALASANRIFNTID